MTFRDVGNHQKLYEAWLEKVKKKGTNLSKQNEVILLGHLQRCLDNGAHYNTLNSKKTRLVRIIGRLETQEQPYIIKLTQSTAYKFLIDLSIDDFKGFASLWHDLMKQEKKLYFESKGKKGKLLPDICQDIIKERGNAPFVYFKFEDLQKMMLYFSQDEQDRMLFMFDTIIRSPTELQNVLVSDLHDDCKELQIRDETSKTFGRTIKLLLCSEAIKKYIERNKLKSNDYLFTFEVSAFNRKLKIVAEQIFKDAMTKGGSPYKDLTMYDFRHSGAIHWRLGAYKSKIDALMYRGGWNNLTILNYYTKKIGMADSIEKQDLMTSIDMNEFEKTKQELEEMKSQMLQMQKQIEFIEKYNRLKHKK
jgi:integrase